MDSGNLQSRFVFVVVITMLTVVKAGTIPNATDTLVIKRFLQGFFDKQERNILEQQYLYCPNTTMCGIQPPPFVFITQSCCADEHCACARDSPAANSICHGVDFTGEQCVRPVARRHKDTVIKLDTGIEGVLMIRSCPTGSRERWEKLCRVLYVDDDHVTNLDSSEKYSEEIFTPVTDVTNNVTYRNVYCAFCHNRHHGNLVAWQPELKCVEYKIIIAHQANDLFKRVASEPACNIYYNPSSVQMPQIPVTRCDNDAYYFQCNQTGLWTDYDPIVESACLSYKYKYKGDYRNIYCAICNGVSKKEMYNQCYERDTRPQLRRQLQPLYESIFVAHLHTIQLEDIYEREKSIEVKRSCSIQGWEVPCQNITCEDFHLLRGEQCKSLYKQQSAHVLGGIIKIFTDDNSSNSNGHPLSTIMDVGMRLYFNLAESLERQFRGFICSKELAFLPKPPGISGGFQYVLQMKIIIPKLDRPRDVNYDVYTWLSNLTYSVNASGTLIDFRYQVMPLGRITFDGMQFTDTENQEFYFTYTVSHVHNPNSPCDVAPIYIEEIPPCPGVIVTRNQTFLSNGTLCLRSHSNECFEDFRVTKLSHAGSEIGFTICYHGNNDWSIGSASLGGNVPLGSLFALAFATCILTKTF